jgi:L,D-peptidoglycan transpeptidase YkuD (ErfK/YbiS/YcfS/YnhG family)
MTGLRGCAAGLVLALAAEPALARTCPLPLAEPRRLVLVTADNFNATTATLRLYERAGPGEAWRAVGAPEPAVVGSAGIAWSHFFRTLARAGEPIKIEGDKRTPAGVYTIGRSFGTVASSRENHLHVTPDTICVDDPSHWAYNSITSRALVGKKVHAENMSRALPMYRRGLLVDYPTSRKARAGSCIFIHVWRSPSSGTAGCVALPEVRVEALQDFAEGGAAVAILPRAALRRLKGCLP